MQEIDLMSIGSYTELPGGNIALPQGYSRLLTPIIKQIPDELILQQKPIKQIQWRHKEEKEAKEKEEEAHEDRRRRETSKTTKPLGALLRRQAEKREASMATTGAGQGGATATGTEVAGEPTTGGEGADMRRRGGWTAPSIYICV